jgi:hypothetical protein
MARDITLLIISPFVAVSLLYIKVWIAVRLAEIISPYFKWEK